jgi:SAM-dependent methyltransferase
VLELGCGSGRLLVPLARDGLRVVGLDRSRPMLDRCRARVAHLPEAVRARARLVEGDFRRFALRRRFPLVVCPFNAMMHLYTSGDVEAFLARVRAHLAPGGIFAFDVLVPDLKWLSRDPEKRWSRTHFKDPRNGRRYVYTTNQLYDPVTQIAWIRIFYDEEEGDPIRGKRPARDLTSAAKLRANPDRSGSANRDRSTISDGKGQHLPHVIHLAQRQFYPQELLALLRYNGFSVEAREGGFAGEPLQEGSESQVCRCSIRGGSRR